MSTLLLLCGEVEYSLVDFNHLVTWCPIRHELLKQKGIQSYLFGDFSPGAERGRLLDLELHKRLDNCLHREAKVNPSLKWAPLAIQQIWWRLARYLWLKECLKKMIKQLLPQRIIISSGEDQDLKRATTSVAAELNVEVEIRSGKQDNSAITLYFSAPYGLPRRVDPGWFHVLRYLVLKILRPGVATYIELYPNLQHVRLQQGVYPFSIRRVVSLVWSGARKIARMFGFSPRETLVDLSSELDDAAPKRLQKELWISFTEDERRMINALLEKFFLHYPLPLLDAVANRLAVIFSVIKPARIILMVDLLDSDRLVAYVAKKYRVLVDYLPHGIGYEDYTGRNNHSLFQPDRVLAWNEDSKETFVSLGWPALAIRHPVNQQAAVPVKSLPLDRSVWKVLVLTRDWEGMTLGGREDCMVVGLMAIYRALTDMGVLGKHIYIKSHFTPITKWLERQGLLLERLRQSLGMEFQIIDPSLKTRQLLPEYNLVILGPTTGIFEAAQLGIPLVFFGPGLDRVGALKGCFLPQAKSGEELKKILETYNCKMVDQAYTRLIRSLQIGEPVV